MISLLCYASVSLILPVELFPTFWTEQTLKKWSIHLDRYDSNEESAEGQLSPRSIKLCQLEGAFHFNSSEVTATLEVQNNATKQIVSRVNHYLDNDLHNK